MSLYLDTSRETVATIAICDRCKTKMSITKLMTDPNAPGLRVCKDCKDEFDPWRMPARKTEDITVRYPRHDVEVADGAGNMANPFNQE